MNNYNFVVTLSDRKNRRHIQAADAKEAIRKAVGERIYSIQLDSTAADGSYAYHDVTVQTGRTVGGNTPVKKIMAYVERDDS